MFDREDDDEARRAFCDAADNLDSKPPDDPHERRAWERGQMVRTMTEERSGHDAG